MDSKQWIESADRVLMHTYGRYPIVLERGDGVYLYDRDQKNTWTLELALQFLPSAITTRNIIMRSKRRWTNSSIHPITFIISRRQKLVKKSQR